MVQIRLLMLMLQPSLISGAGVIAASAVILIGVNWSYVTYNPQWYDLFYGQFGITTAFEGAPNVLREWQETILASPLVYAVAVILIATSLAVVVFLIARTLVSGWRTMKLLKSRSGELYEVRERAIVRAIVLGVWVIYALFTVIIIVPFCILLSRIGAEELSTLGGVIENLSAGALLILTLHGHIILARLFCLRPRVFGGQRLVTEAFISKH